MGSSKEIILKTLLYSDIFDYPLLKEEIWKFLISKNRENKEAIYKYLNLKSNFFSKKNNLFFVKGREEIIKKRLEKEKYSLEKIKFAKKIIQKIGFIPMVSFIGISGALAMKNSDINDDVDLFIITTKNSVWTTRLLLVSLLILLGVYRKRNKKNVSNKICLNMLIDDSALALSKNRMDLYTAHEIAQIVPIFNRNNTYERFLSSNIWVKDFLPNVFNQELNIPFIIKLSPINKIINIMFANSIIEFLAQNIQFCYMKKYITKETISNNFLAFHPFDYKKYVLNKYKKKIEKYGYSISY